MKEPNRERKGEIKYLISLDEDQKEAKRLVIGNQITIITGPAGSGKSLISAIVALDFLNKKQVETIHVTRAAIETGHSLGFLPGNLSEKFDPYLEAFTENLFKCMDKVKIENILKEGKIKAMPVQFIRGKTVDDILVVEECLSRDAIVTLRLDTGSIVNSIMHKVPFYYKTNNNLEILSYNHTLDKNEFKKINSLRIGKTNKWLDLYDNNKSYPLSCTENHPICIMTDEGKIEYVPAKNIKIGDSFFKMQDNNKAKHNILSYDNLDILSGFLLGDGSLSKNKQKNDCARVCKNHGLAQKEYMLFCMSLFKNAKEAKVKSGFTGEPICGFTSKSYTIPKKIRRSFYKGKNKQVSEEIIDYLSPRSLALWYMDDGNLGASDRIRLHTEGFNKNSIFNILNALKIKFNIEGNLMTYKKHYDSKDIYYHVIDINKENSAIFFNLIKKLVHPNLKYKIPSIYWEDFDNDLYKTSKDIHAVYTGTIVDVIERDLQIPEITYNMEVADNNNYFANSVLTHNCQNLTPHEMLAILTRIGKTGKIIINGDPAQRDTKDSFTGLDYAIELSKSVDKVKWIKLKGQHRSDLVSEILEWDQNRTKKQN